MYDESTWLVELTRREAQLIAAGVPAADLQALMRTIEASLSDVFAYQTPTLGTHPALIPWLPHSVVQALFEKLVDSPARQWLFDDLDDASYPLFARSHARNAARLPRCPVAVLRSLASNPGRDVRKAVARHPACPSELLADLAADVSESVRARVAAHQACPQDALMRLARDPAPSVRTAITLNPACPLSLLEALAEDAEVCVRAAVALSPGCPEPLRETLIDVLVPAATSNYGLSRQLAELAQLAETSAALLTRLADAEDQHVRITVARHESCPTSLLERLSRDPERNVRCAVAANPRIPAPVLTELARDADYFVRWEVALHRPVPADLLPALRALLNQLASDESHYVRASVASHPDCPVATLRQLAGDPEEDVRREVAVHPHCPVDVRDLLAQQGNCFAQARQASDAACARGSLALFAQSGDDFVRRAVAGNRAAPADLLDLLSADHDEWVRREVAENPQTPTSALARLADDPDLLVRRSVAQHPACPPDLSESIWRAMLAAAHTPLRIASLSSPDRPVWLLKALAVDPQIDVRNRVYADLRLPDDVRRYLRERVRDLVHACGHAREALTLAQLRYPACPAALPLLAVLQADCPRELVLAKLQSPDPRLRLAAALNPTVAETDARRAVAPARDD